MVTRTVPQAIGTTHLGNSITPNSLTTAAYGDTVAAEAQSFAYSPDGQISQASGCDASVNRTFDPNGEMRSEALTIRGVAAGCGAATHSYTTGYTYDGDGRRATMTVPAIFTTSAGGTVTYSYTVGTGGGRLTGVTDAAGNPFIFSYKPSGELTQTTGPGGVSRTLSWDSDGRLLSDLIRRPSTCGPDWPCFAFTGPYRSTSFGSYDPQGRLLNSTDASIFAEGTTASYTPLGHLASSTLTQKWIGSIGSQITYTSTESLTPDGIGNPTARQEGWTVSSGSGSNTTNTTTATAYDATGRQTGFSPGGSGSWVKSYDLAGNLEWEQRTVTNVTEERASFYAADQTLRSVDRRTGDTRWWDHYRYDPLGRRVLVIGQIQCAPFNSLACYTSRVRRTVWDGADELAEIQVPYDSTNYWERDTGTFPLEYYGQHGTSATGDPNPMFGQVLYGPGVSVDQPLSVTRFNYGDRPTGPGIPFTAWPTFTLLPQWNVRGAATFGVFSDGAGYKSLDGVSQTSCPFLGATTTNRCVVLQWQAGQTAYNLNRAGAEPLSWFGTVLEGKRDGVGLEYKRNRYYDPQSGHFTQGDPIGVAGGLNAYGFGSGDPINFGDPFGLCPWCIGALIGGAGGFLGTVAYNYANDRPITTNLLRNTLIGGAAGATLGLGYSVLGGGAGGAAMGAAAGATPVVQSAAGKLEQLAERFGTSSTALVEAGKNATTKLLDMRPENLGNINALVPRLDGASGFIRVTFDPSMQRVISAGLMRANQVSNGLAAGRFVPLH